MKKYLLILLILLSFVIQGFAQSEYGIRKHNTKRKELIFRIARYTLFAAAGYAEGVNDVIYFHYDDFKRVHPHANDMFWNPAISWKNKYEDYDAGNRNEKFWGASTMFVGLTDGFHMTNSIDHLSMLGGATLTIPLDGKKRQFKWYAKEFAYSFIANRLGFYLSYNVVYRHKD